MNIFILQSQQAAWHSRSLIVQEPGAGNDNTLVLDNSSGSSVSLTGLEIIGQQSGNTLNVLNRGSDAIILLPNNTESIAANRFADNATIAADTSARLYYNGLKWELLSVAGGGGIGVDFDAQGLSTDVITLWNENFTNFQGATATLKIGDLHPAWGGTIYRDINQGGWAPHYSIDVEPVVNLYNSAPFAGIQSYPIMRAAAGTNSSVFGIQGQVQSYGNGIAPWTGKLSMTGVYGAAYVRSQNENAGYGGFFESFTGGNLGGTNTTPLWGVFGKAAGGHNGVTPQVRAAEFLLTTVGGGGVGSITDGRGVQISVDGSQSITDFDTIKGLSISGWIGVGVGRTWLKSYGIYIDSSIDKGTVEKYAIKSDSVSDSLFAGPVRGPINAYDQATWNGSNKFATEDAVRDKFESIGASGITGSGVNTQAAFWSSASTLVAVPFEYASNRFLFFQNTNADSFEMKFKGSNADAGEFWVGKQSGGFPVPGYIKVADAASNAGIITIAAKTVRVGDYDGYFNNTYLLVDDANNSFTFENGGGSTGSGQLDFRKTPKLLLSRTITSAGTTGAQTINRTAGQVNLAAGQQTLVVTNNKAAADSLIIPFIMTDDATAKSVIVTRAAGSFTFKTNAAATGEVALGFVVLN